MARVSYQLHPLIYSQDGIDIEEVSLTARQGSKAVYTDINSGDRMVLVGKDLEYTRGELVDGTISNMAIVDNSGENYITVKGFHLDAGRFGDGFIENFEDILADIYKNDMRFIGANRNDTMVGRNGDDLIAGRGGDDMLGGNAGKDILVGGAGADNFVFFEGDGKDRIRDFDADGSDGEQDYLQAVFAEVESITKSGKNTIIDFGDGDVLTLLNIKPNQIDQTDFYTNIIDM